MAIYAIGDLQGCYDEFLQLLDKIHFNADVDQLWLTGDVVNRGPKSLATLRKVYAMRDNIILVLGNHDLHLLATAYHHRQPGRHDTLDELLGSSDNQQLLEWLRQQPLIHRDPALGLCLVHAGIHPQWTIDKAFALAGEVEQILQSDAHAEFYPHMYGDTPALWSDTLEGWPRLRMITNILTRMRYVAASGLVLMNPKGAPGTQPRGLLPWYELNRDSASDGIIFGHWSSLPPAADYEKYKVYPVDSGCLWGGLLSALRIDLQPYQWTRLNCRQGQDPQLHL